jgi:hypothetical protein
MQMQILRVKSQVKRKNRADDLKLPTAGSRKVAKLLECRRDPTLGWPAYVWIDLSHLYEVEMRQATKLFVGQQLPFDYGMLGAPVGH